MYQTETVVPQSAIRSFLGIALLALIPIAEIAWIAALGYLLFMVIKAWL